MAVRWLTRRVDEALAMIADFRAKQALRPYVSCSFGKDSLVLLWLVRQMDPCLPVVWFDGGKYDEHPETPGFVARVRAQWSLNHTTVYPLVPLVEQWRRHGVPRDRHSAQDRIYTREFVEAFLRESRARGYDGHYLGMRAAESRYRRYVFGQRGPIYYVPTEGLWRCNPLWHWSTREVWDLIDTEGLPVHPVYTQTRLQPRENIRLGVLAETCFAHRGSIAHFRLYYPSLWNELCAEFPAVAGYVS